MRNIWTIYAQNPNIGLYTMAQLVRSIGYKHLKRVNDWQLTESTQRIYRIDSERDYGMLAGLIDRADRTINTDLIAKQWDRIGHFYASLEQGHTTASVALKRLADFNAKKRFYRANRDLGRIFKRVTPEKILPGRPSKR